VAQLRHLRAMGGPTHQQQVLTRSANRKAFQQQKRLAKAANRGSLTQPTAQPTPGDACGPLTVQTSQPRLLQGVGETTRAVCASVRCMTGDTDATGRSLPEVVKIHIGGLGQKRSQRLWRLRSGENRSEVAHVTLVHCVVGHSPRFHFTNRVSTHTHHHHTHARTRTPPSLTHHTTHNGRVCSHMTWPHLHHHRHRVHPPDETVTLLCPETSATSSKQLGGHAPFCSNGPCDLATRLTGK
jgi:hypothetical protein